MKFYSSGAAPYYRRKEDVDVMAMTRLMSIYKVLNKKEIPYEINGKSGKSYRITVSQQDDTEILEERVSQALFETLEKGKVYNLWGTKRINRDGSVRILFDYGEVLTGNEKAIMK